MWKSALSTLFLLLFSVLTWAQSNPNWQKKAGLDYFKDRDYVEALSLFKDYYEQKPEDYDILLKIAICAYHTDEIEEAYRYLNLLLAQSKKNSPTLYLYTARILHRQQEFERAIRFYKDFLRQSKQDNQVRENAKAAILNCAAGLKLEHYSVRGVVDNLGERINSSANDFRPVASPNYDDLVYFTSIREGQLDILGADLPQNKEGQAELLNSEVNSTKNEELVGFNQAGSAMFFYQYSKGQSLEILVDSFRQNSILETVELPIFDTPLQDDDRTPFFFNDSTLLFASQRLAGYGGYDLFLTRRRRNGWSIPQNLGAVINSPYNECAPQLGIDGCTLFFSADHPHHSIGGYDLFRSVFDIKTECWGIPENLGTTINSSQDELDFYLTKNPARAFFCSNRWEGQGGQDIYLLRFAEEQAFLELENFLFDDAHKYKQEEQLAKFKIKKQKGLSYRIQLTSDSKLDKSIIPENYPHRKVELDEHGNGYYYLTGFYRTFRSAEQLQVDLLKNNWPAARIIPYVNGIRLKEEEIEFFSKEYADLERFLRSQGE